VLKTGGGGVRSTFRAAGEEPEGSAPYSALSGRILFGKLGGNAESFVPDEGEERLILFCRREFSDD